MKYTWMFLVSSIISVVFLILLSRSISIGNQSIPAIGHFLNPFTGFWNQAESGRAGSQEEYRSPFLEDSIRIEFDNRMIPHVFAVKESDAFYAQGFLHAQYRLFQMDMTARAMTGRLSEIIGEQSLSRDIFARRINFQQSAENKYHSWQNHPEMMALVEAYVRGVNDYIKTLHPKNYPLEYKLLDATPELWTVQKSISVSLSLAATLNLNLQDFSHTNTLWHVGQEIYDKLFPLYPDTLLPVDIERERYPDSVPVLAPQNYEELSYLRGQMPPDPGPGIGSNNWAVRASLTQDSVPMLANDPHLRLSLPSIWYELQLKTPYFNTHGVSVPGMPGIVIGFNNNIAWGMTNAPIDVLDCYKIQWDDKQKGTYILDGEVRQAELREEVIKIKGQSSHIEEVYDTWWGPVLYRNGSSTDHNIAIKWMSALPNEKSDLKTLYGLMRGKNLYDYQTALENFYAPGQNIVFASSNDSIAITVQGKFPIKRPGQGRFVLDGSSTNNDWQGIIPLEDLPGMVNPERKYVISANEWSTYPEYPYYYSGNFDHYRGRAISQYLDSEEPLTVNKMKDIQNSNFNLKAAEILPVLLSYLPQNIANTDLADSLQNWNYHYEPDSRLPTFTELWITECKRLAFDEISPVDSISLMDPYTWRLNELLLNPSDLIFDQKSTPAIKENAYDIVLSAWRSAMDLYNSIPISQRAWGKHASLSITHLLGIPDFSHNELMTGGNGNTINATTTTNGPSWRMIVELGKDSVTGHVIYPGGQSGNPGSKYYDNFIEDWLHGNYYTVSLASRPEEVSKSIHYSIHLIPQ